MNNASPQVSGTSIEQQVLLRHNAVNDVTVGSILIVSVSCSATAIGLSAQEKARHVLTQHWSKHGSVTPTDSSAMEIQMDPKIPVGAPPVHCKHAVVMHSDHSTDIPKGVASHAVIHTRMNKTQFAIMLPNPQKRLLTPQISCVACSMLMFNPETDAFIAPQRKQRLCRINQVTGPASSRS